MLESLDIEAVVSPQNKMNVAVYGWVLPIFENVHLILPDRIALIRMHPSGF